MVNHITIEDIARTAHETNKALCEAFGDTSQVSWEEAEEWQRKSAITSVEFIRDNPKALPSATHESWLSEKERDGWKYGPVKDPVKKEHPCFVPYDDLPPDQKAKDYVFGAIARSMLKIKEELDIAFNGITPAYLIGSKVPANTIKDKVYGHDECIFVYCPSPEECKTNPKGCVNLR